MSASRLDSRADALARPCAMASEVGIDGIVFPHRRRNDRLHCSSRACELDQTKRRHLLALPLE